MKIVIFGSPNPIRGFSDQLYNLSTYVKPYAKSLGVIFESGFMFNKQMKWNEVVNLLVLILRFVYTTLIGFASSYISGLLSLTVRTVNPYSLMLLTGSLNPF